MAKTHTRTEARVAAGALVVSFASDTPKVWRTEMKRLDTAAFELKDAKDRVMLVLVTAAGPEDVYAFEDRADAAAALHAITQALFVQRQEESFDHFTPPAQKSHWFWRLLKTVFYIALAVIALLVLLVFARAKPADMAARDLRPPVAREGVPVPADKLLGQPEGK